MTDTNDDDRDEPTLDDLFATTFDALERAVDDIREGIEQADKDEPLGPQSPFERLRERLERLEDEAGEADEGVKIDIEDELNTIREAQGKDLTEKAEAESEFVFGDDGWDDPPGDARYCPRCGEALEGNRTHLTRDLLLNRYRAEFWCPACNYHGEVIRHDV